MSEEVYNHPLGSVAVIFLDKEPEPLLFPAVMQGPEIQQIKI